MSLTLKCIALTLLLLSSSAQARPAKVNLSLSVSWEMGVVSMSRFREGMTTFSQTLQSINPNIEIVDSSVGLMYALLPRMRLYLPHQTFVEAGLGYMRNAGQINLRISGLPARFSFTNITVEAPLLFGLHLANFKNAHAYAALGPSLLLYNRSHWNYDQGKTSSFAASRGGGVEFLLGADLFIHKRVSLGICLRYRILRSNALSRIGKRYPPEPNLGELDYTGGSFGFSGRWHSF